MIQSGNNGIQTQRAELGKYFKAFEFDIYF